MKHSYQATPYASQSEPQYNPLGNANRQLFDAKTSSAASPMLTQTHSQRSVGNGIGLLHRSNNASGRSNQLSMATMSQLGGIPQSQQQFHSSRPLSSGYTPGASQPALSGVFRPGSAPQRPTSSQLELQTASQWTQPAVTSSLAVQGYATTNTASMLQHLPATNQPVLRPKQVALMRTSAAAPPMQGRPGSAPGLLSAAPAAASLASTPKQQYLQPSALLQQSQHPHSSSQQQRQYHHYGSQGGLRLASTLLGSQQQQCSQDFATAPHMQQDFPGAMMLDEGSAGTGVTIGAESAAVALAGPAAERQKLQQQPGAALGSTTVAFTDRLGPRLRELLQEDTPPLHQQPQQVDTVTADKAAATNTNEPTTATPAALELTTPAQPSVTPQEPAATATAAPMHIDVSGHAGGSIPAGTAGNSAQLTAASTTTAPVSAVNFELISKRISCLEEYCSSMHTIILKDIPLLMQQQDSTSKQITALADKSSSNHAVLETGMQQVTTAISGFMDVLKVWQQEQHQHHIQQLQEQTAKRQVLSHAACQTSPGLVVAKLPSSAPAALCHTAEAAARNAAAPAAIPSPLGNRYDHNASANQQKPACIEHACAKVGLCCHFAGNEQEHPADGALTLVGQQWGNNPSTAAAAALHLTTAHVDSHAAVEALAGDVPVEDYHAASVVAGEAEDKQNVPATRQRQHKQTSHQPKEKTANRPTKKRTAELQGKKGQARAKAAAAQAEVQAATAVNASKLQPAAALAAPSGGCGKQAHSSLVQSKLSFTRMVTRGTAAKPPLVATMELAGTQTSKQSPATGGSTDLLDSMDGVAVTALVTGALSHPGKSEPAEAPIAWFMDDRSCPQSSRSLPQHRMGTQVHSKPQHDGILGIPASGTAAAASDAGRTFHRCTTPTQACVLRAAEATASVRVFAGRPGSQMHHKHHRSSPASPASPGIITVPEAATVRQTAQPVAKPLPPTKATSGAPAEPAAAGVAAAAGAERGKPGAATAVGKQTSARSPPAAGSWVGMVAQAAAAVVAKHTCSGVEGLSNRPGLSSHYHQQQRGQNGGGTSRLLGMKRSAPEPAAALSAAPARSSVLMLFGDMDSYSTDYVHKEDSQQLMVTGSRHSAKENAQQSATVAAAAAATVTINPTRRGSDTPGALAQSPSSGAHATLPATDTYQIDEEDIARQVAARMAQHRRKQRRVTGGCRKSLIGHAGGQMRPSGTR